MDKDKKKDKFIKFRVTQAQFVYLNHQAKQAGITVSDLLRRRSFYIPVIHKTDVTTGKELKRLGALLKHLYPWNKASATNEDKKQFFATMELLKEAVLYIFRGAG